MTQPTKPRELDDVAEDICDKTSLPDEIDQYWIADIVHKSVKAGAEFTKPHADALEIRVRELEAGNFRKILDQEKAYLQDALNAERAANAELSRKLAKAVEQRDGANNAAIDKERINPTIAARIKKDLKQVLDDELNGDK